MTGFAQTRMGREESWAEKLAHDLEYIADRSVGLYLRVVLETAWRIVRRTLAAALPSPPASVRGGSSASASRG